MGLEHLLARYGLLAVLLGTALEGDLSMVLSGVLAHQGYFPFPLALGAAALGAFVADCCWYFVGRTHSERFRSGSLYRRVGPRIERVARRFGAWQLLAARFVYGTKNASMLFWGLHGLPVLRFVLVDALSCLLGASFFAGIGYLVGNGADALLGKVKRFEFVLLGAVVVAVIVLLLIRGLARRRAPPVDEAV
jgi:membrane protein DedA with SNARE-associated domain